MNHFLRTKTSMNMISVRCTSTVLMAALVMISPGCTQTSMLRSLPGRISNLRGKPPQPQAARVLCLWESAEGQGLDGQNARGFAGQVLFFGYGEASPIPVNGTVKIYQYDNYDPADEQSKPIHVFTFESAAWNVHRSEGTVGEGYNVFIPYMSKHSDVAHCGLKVELTTDDGRSVMSPITEISLAARPSRRRRNPSALRRDIVHNPQQLTPSQDGPAGQTSQRIEGRQLDSLTIQLPQSQE